MSTMHVNLPVSAKAARAAKALLRDRLSAYGFVRADVAPGLDHDGDPVLYIDVHYRPTGEPFPASVTFGLVTEVREALEARGEQRFPHVRHLLGDDIRVVRGP